MRALSLFVLDEMGETLKKAAVRSCWPHDAAVIPFAAEETVTEMRSGHERGPTVLMHRASEPCSFLTQYVREKLKVCTGPNVARDHELGLHLTHAFGFEFDVSMEASTLFRSLASPATSQSTSEKPFPGKRHRALPPYCLKTSAAMG